MAFLLVKVAHLLLRRDSCWMRWHKSSPHAISPSALMPFRWNQDTACSPEIEGMIRAALKKSQVRQCDEPWIAPLPRVQLLGSLCRLSGEKRVWGEDLKPNGFLGLEECVRGFEEILIACPVCFEVPWAVCSCCFARWCSKRYESYVVQEWTFSTFTSPIPTSSLFTSFAMELE